MKLVKNSALNIAGSIVPAIVALPAIGYLARALDTELFGLLTLAWALVGYATLFDLGLSRAVAQQVARSAAPAEDSRLILGTALFAVMVSGVVIAVLLYGFAAPLVDYVFNVSAGNRADGIDGVKALSVTIPLLLVTLITQGYLEGRGMFVESNLQKAITGSLVFLFPALAVYFVPSFESAVNGIALARLFAFGLALVRCNRIISIRSCAVRLQTLRELFHYGAGIALTNTISPIMGYLDRFLLSSVHGAHAVGHYTAAAELVSRFSIVPVAISRALFPQLAAAGANAAAAKGLASSARLYTAITCLPLAVVVLMFAAPLLELWLGSEYAETSALILQILVVGFALNAFAQVPFSAIQARGQSYLTAKIQLFEVVPYIALLYILASEYGAVGVAVSWTTRIGVDLLVMEFFARRAK